MALFDQFKSNPLIQADIQQRQQNPMPQQAPLPSNDQLVQMAKEGKISHMGGKLPDFLSGLVTQAKDMVGKVIQGGTHTIDVNNAQASTGAPAPLNTDVAVNSLIGHESRGTLTPSTTINPGSGATGGSQITPVMMDQYNKLTGHDLSTQDIVGNDALQRTVTSTLVDYLIGKYKNGLSDWPVKTPKLQNYKDEIKRDFNQPIYWVAGEWIAGPNWVAKLDKPTAPGATETVRDYIKRVGEMYNSQNTNTA